eukprot:TRINITY_DN802_c0_g2_i2.p1 TRINITY_DN802_c0_g2~~TRINITY_DN802_c0_g2_i2.p1  ORF type:complete len:149 (+),score=34.20 TRINITY_DN802_c0_g2_i2:56-502(+)
MRRHFPRLVPSGLACFSNKRIVYSRNYSNVSVESIKALRKQTLAGMMDCKKALEASEGDMDKALLWLHERAKEIAKKKADRITSEGLLGISVKDNVGVMVELNCETDFVPRLDSYKTLTQEIVQAALDFDADKIKNQKEKKLALIQNL